MTESSTERFSVISDGLPSQLPDVDPDETQEWLDSLDAVVDSAGRGRARYLMLKLLERAREKQVGVPALRSTDYINTIPPEREPWFPGDEHVERRVRAYVRWNAAIQVSRANRPEIGVGGHIATYASAASLYEVGFNHFFRGKDHPGGGDQVFFQGHASPGIYARAYLEGRLTQDQLDAFRQESSPHGLPSYPHPRSMPDFWEFPTVSMGLGPLHAIYQARFNRYLHHRGIKDTSDQHVWCFLGDGEMDEPESLGAIGVAAREELDNLTFVVNCNLQRLDGPVRGNGKIIQELESYFRGAGWNVIKVVWARQWDDLLARDVDGVLVNAMNTTPDGQFQTYSVEDGAYTREKFFGTDPRLRRMVEHLTDDDIRQRLPRGGHDYRKVYSAFAAAQAHSGQPTVILAHTVKGWTLGKDFEGRNATHQMKKLTVEELKELRDRLYLDISDKALESGLPPYFHPGPHSQEIEYMKERREALGGSLPRRVDRSKPLALPPSEAYDELKRGSGKQAVATTMAFVRLLKDLMKDKGIGQRIVPVIPDEARTFGIDAMFPTAKIYSPFGQTYEAVDRALLLSYKESTSGQILHEGITEAGSMASVIAAGTSYATHGEPMIPVYVFYSMFGFQRTGDQMWAMGDQLGRGFLLGATAGRTTLNGEGLQHQDGHSLLLASTNPAVVAYDPAFGFEIAFIAEDGLRRMYGEAPEDVFYYLTVYNEPYPQPAMPDVPDLREGVLRGLYRYRPGSGEGPRAQVLASGVSVRHALEAQQLLREDWGVVADVWSVTSWNELRRDAVACEADALLDPGSRRTPFITQALAGAPGPVVAVSDWMRAVPDQVSRWVQHDWSSLGTDGYGRSDTRAALRRHFHTDAESIAVAVLNGLAAQGGVGEDVPGAAVDRYRLREERVPAGKDTQAGSSEVSG
ncbi:MAG: 2-oxo-acid dehydrogenase subunit, homodimeric type [Frankiales bacterium]|nr:2-oxo-acid dehydrogenase subunit, homodimeric type [Frankiales bacterium]